MKSTINVTQDILLHSLVSNQEPDEYKFTGFPLDQSVLGTGWLRGKKIKFLLDVSRISNTLLSRNV
jgi:hypothetical protein